MPQAHTSSPYEKLGYTVRVGSKTGQQLKSIRRTNPEKAVWHTHSQNKQRNHCMWLILNGIIGVVIRVWIESMPVASSVDHRYCNTACGCSGSCNRMSDWGGIERYMYLTSLEYLK